jgi:acyl-CoA reductase-like NAD-dependent aldehyde dehydrogenase
VERIMDWIKEAKELGAKILTGGKISRGNTIEPTVLGETPAICMIMREEAFAPIVNLHPVKNASQAIKTLNDSKYGLQVGVFTNNHNLVMDAFDDLEVGGVVINDVPTFRVDNMPYGGIKDSGFGREGLKYAMEDMTELKIMVINQNKRDRRDY